MGKENQSKLIEPSWVVCAGSKRSGSTLQYNIIARIVEIAKKGLRIPYFNPSDFPKIKLDYQDEKKIKVFKTHSLTDEIKDELNENNAIVFHSYRDIRDVVVSAINKGWLDRNESSIRKFVLNYISQFYEWKNYFPRLNSRKYEKFIVDLDNEISFYAEILGVNLFNSEIKGISWELNIDRLKQSQDKIPENKIATGFNQKFHNETLLHDNHISDGSINQYLKDLEPDLICYIESISYTYLIDNDYKLKWADLNTFLSFSQHADDYIAWQLLGRKKQGLVVEVGAFDGKHLSNSLSLEQIGWKSLNIEPNPRIFDYLKKNRPNSININMAIVGDEDVKEIDFFSEEIGVLSGCAYDEEDVKLRYKNRGLTYKEPKKISVKATTLNRLFKESDMRHIDALSIDVEGFEMEVLNGLDLDEFKVELFIIEANADSDKKQILDYFKNREEYMYVGSNRQNLFIILKDSLKKTNVRHLELKKYIKAKQEHPISDHLVIDSVKPLFKKSKDCKRYQSYLRFF
ncbi:MAG: FkbM family methyltransferase [Bacteroidota bacterium]